jgi:hypothetical protein
MGEEGRPHFGMLGPLEVTDDGRPLDLVALLAGGPRRRRGGVAEVDAMGSSFCHDDLLRLRAELSG